MSRCHLARSGIAGGRRGTPHQAKLLTRRALSVCKIAFDSGTVDPQLAHSMTLFMVGGRDCSPTVVNSSPMPYKNLNACRTIRKYGQCTAIALRSIIPEDCVVDLGMSQLKSS